MDENRIKVSLLQSDDSSWNVFGVENEQFESMVEGAENDLSCGSTSSGIYGLQVKDDDDWPMVEKKGNQFVVNSQPFYVNGFNTYWLMVFAADQSTRGKVSEVFQQASSVGLTVCRTWAFNDGQWRALQKSPSVYDEEVFQALDFVVSEAKKYKIRLILTLTNNWEAYGGKSQYVKWGKAAGLNLTSDDEFFSHPTLRSYYKAHVKAVLNRVNTFTNITYKNDPTIFAWELMNEPRCTSDASGNTLQFSLFAFIVYLIFLMHRQAEDVMTFLRAEMGTSGSLDGAALVSEGSPDTIRDKGIVVSFSVVSSVVCPVCSPIKTGFVARVGRRNRDMTIFTALVLMTFCNFKCEILYTYCP
ncbi:mannan endo-1,4-beta-mannosidase 6-like [Pistacia vera]|uniref:mannan endo-1,4-beta-mannosidase 6-like n=1 Tax=Pistacia vera TaxID=55513 RepID=UPI0012638DCB|nr:mannan endo-1,4-beta-mannosidase 6-like [Pistacia vera]